MFAFLGKFAYRRRWLVLGGTIVFLVAAIVAGPGVFSRLKSGGFQDPSAESVRAGTVLADRFRAGSTDLLLLVTAPGSVDAPAAVRSGTDLTAKVTAEKGVKGVVSYWPGAVPGLRSTAGNKALLLVRLDHAGDENDKIADRLATKYEGTFEGLKIQAGGPGVGLGKTIGADLAKAESFAVPITLVLLLLVFGGVVAALLPLALGALAIMGTFLALFLVSLITDVSIFSINLATALGLGLAIDYSLLVVVRFREELANGLDTEAAIARTVETAGRTVAFSAITVAVALSALLIFPLYFLSSFAYAGVAVVLIAALGGLLTLPALLAVLGPRVNNLAVGRRRSKADSGAGFWYSLSHTVMRRPVRTGLPVVIVLAALAVPFLGVSFSLPDDRDLPPSNPARIVGDSVRHDFTAGAARSFPVVLPKATAEQTTELATAISRVPKVSRVEASTGSFENGAKVADPTPAGQRLKDATGSYLEVSSNVEPVSSAGAGLVKAVRALKAGVPFLVAGPAAELVDSKSAIFGLVPVALLLVAGATFVLLFLMTGSVLIPVKAIVLNVLSLGATFGAMVWVFQDGHGSSLLSFTPTGSLNTTIPILMFCIAFGLSMDYEVFLLSRIKEERDHSRDTTSAVAVGLQKTGRIMTAAAAILAVTFTSFATSQVTFIKLMGVGLTIAVLMDATLVRGVLVPAFMRLAGEANWWAPPLLRRLHDRFGISEGPSGTRAAPTGARETVLLRQGRVEDARVAWLRRVPLLGHASPEGMRQVAALLRPKTVPAGGIVSRDNAPLTELCLLDAGTLSVAWDFRGTVTETARLGAGQLFGEVALLGGARGAATVTAVTDAQLWTLSYDDFAALLARDPELAAVVAHAVRGAAPRPTPSAQQVRSGNLATLLQDRPELRLGRDRGNDIVLDAPQVSRFHAVAIRESGGGCRVSDLDSRVGTFVNKTRVRTAVLQEGDEVWIGHARFVYAAAEVTAGEPVGAR